MATNKFKGSLYDKNSKSTKVQTEINKVRNGKPSKISKNSILANSPAIDTTEGNLWASMGKDEVRQSKSIGSAHKRAEQIRKNAGDSAADLYFLGAQEYYDEKLRNKINAGRYAGDPNSIANKEKAKATVAKKKASASPKKASRRNAK